MAQIILSSHELISILQANAQIPPQITELTVDTEEIRFRVKTDWPILKSIRVGMRFVNFDSGCMVLQLATNLLTDKFSWFVDRMMEPLRLEEHGGRWEYPRLYINVNWLIERQLRGVAVENIVLQDGLFHVTTTHVNSAAGDLQGQNEKGTDLLHPSPLP
jgi:hypothetical protein